MGRFAEQPATPPTVEKVDPEVQIGARCEIVAEGRRGSIAFVGGTEFAKGMWIGVELDEPKEGKGDGSCVNPSASPIKLTTAEHCGKAILRVSEGTCRLR